MSYKFLIRFDAGGEHGLGHYSRCMAIGRQLLSSGPAARVQVLSQKTAFMQEEMENSPFETILRDKIDAGELIDHVRQTRPDLLFFDKLEDLGADGIKELKKYTKVVLFQYYFPSAVHADTVIIPAAHIGNDRLPWLTGAHDGGARVYSGADYVVINEGLSGKRELFRLEEQIRSIAVTTGGTDPEAVMIRLLQLIDFQRSPQVRFHFFPGKGFMHADRLSSFRKIPNVGFLPFDLGEIARNDLVIATFGITTYELLFLGMPVISVAHAASNAAGSRYLARHYECLYDLGLAKSLERDPLNTAIDTMASDPGLRKSYHAKGMELVDGQGARRVAQIMLNT